MVQVLGELSELGPRALLLPDLLVTQLLLMVVIEEPPNVLVLVGNVRQVLLACVEIVLILATVVPTVVSLDYFGLLVEKPNSSVHFDSVGGLSSDESANVAPPGLLNQNCLSLDMLIAPFVAEHAPVRLYTNSG